MSVLLLVKHGLVPIHCIDKKQLYRHIHTYNKTYYVTVFSYTAYLNQCKHIVLLHINIQQNQSCDKTSTVDDVVQAHWKVNHIATKQISYSLNNCWWNTILQQITVNLIVHGWQVTLHKSSYSFNNTTRVNLYFSFRLNKNIADDFLVI